MELTRLALSSRDEQTDRSIDALRNLYIVVLPKEARRNLCFLARERARERERKRTRNKNLKFFGYVHVYEHEHVERRDYGLKQGPTPSLCSPVPTRKRDEPKKRTRDKPWFLWRCRVAQHLRCIATPLSQPRLVLESSLRAIPLEGCPSSTWMSR